jgi:SAM-dependent methyltransferase
MGVKQFVPWWAKIAAKIVLSRAHFDYGWWQKRGLFVHGEMDRPAYAFRVVMSHLDRIGWPMLAGKVVLELGPGDSLATAVIARTLGAERCYLADAGPFAQAGLHTYLGLQEYIETQGLTPPNLRDCQTLDAILDRCHAVYLTDGVSGLRRIADASVDLVFSQAVLEHVRLSQFAQIQQEMRRVLRRDGLASHQVDLKDHLAGALNNLRFSDSTWEAGWMVRSGFYTNRLRLSEVIAAVRAAGLVAEVTDVQRWSELPTPRARLAARFQAMSDEELLVKQFDFIARPTLT